MTDTLYCLTATSLRELAASLKDGQLAAGIGSHAVKQIVGPDMMADVYNYLTELQNQGWTTLQMGVLVASIADAMDRTCSPDKLFDIVLSGPRCSGYFHSRYRSGNAHAY
ncbi:MAG: hypothetical protein ABIA59_00230 [Candidatus Latescibacterota bacterium]